MLIDVAYWHQHQAWLAGPQGDCPFCRKKKKFATPNIAAVTKPLQMLQCGAVLKPQLILVMATGRAEMNYRKIFTNQ